MNRRWWHLLVLVVFPVLLAGCGGNQAADPEVFISAQTALKQGMEAYEAKDYQAAVTNLDTAVTGGGLLPDLYADALLKRAECNARLGNFPAAHEDLDKAARGADMAEVYRVRHFVFEKEGNSAESRKALTAGKKINSRLKPIVD